MINILIKLLEIGMYLFALLVACYINDDKKTIDTLIIYLLGNWIGVIIILLERGI